MNARPKNAVLLKDLRDLIDFAAQENVHHPDYDLAAAFESALTKAEAVAWVIANGQGRRWRCWGDSGPEWTADRDAALHFARRSDAEAVAREDEDAWLIQPVQGSRAIAAWMTPESIAHLEQQNGVAKVDAWNCANGAFRVPVYAHAPPAVPVESRYECRECDNCGHAGINDANLTQGACFSCEWSGPEPVEDKCPGCGDEGCMTAACPKCGARYRFIAELEPAILPAEPVASVPDGWLLGWARAAEIEKTQRHRSKREGSALAVFVHAEKNETYSVPVYASSTNQEGAAP